MKLSVEMSIIKSIHFQASDSEPDVELWKVLSSLVLISWRM